MAVSLEDYVDRIAQSGLMTEAELEEFAQPSGDVAQTAQSLARELVRAGKLTKFQAQAIYGGKSRGLVLGNYVILDKIGAGGMGEVYRAEHRRMKRVVALKVLPSEMVKDDTAVQRFHREVQAAARLSHPNIVAAFDADETKGVHFYVMEFVDGVDLATLVRSDGLPPLPVAIDYIAQAARGLQYAHEQGVVHRDIKPSNILVDAKGTVKILDMGLARIEEGSEGSALTQTGAVMGTVDFMSPEQAYDTKQADVRSDVYSLGCTLWYLLTARTVYSGDTVMKRLLAHREAPIPSLLDNMQPHLAADETPGPEWTALDTVFRRMVAKDPDDRYQSMSQVAAALEACHVAAVSPTTNLGKSPPGDDTALEELFAAVEVSQSMTIGAVGDEPAASTAETMPSGFLDPTVPTGLTSAESDPNSKSSLWSELKDLISGHQRLSIAGGVLLLLVVIGSAARQRRQSPPPDPAPTAGGSALAFDGVDDYVVVESLPLNDLPLEQPLTIEFRVRWEEGDPCNMVSWLGEHWIAIFHHQGRWGAGRLHDGPPDLVQGVEAAAQDEWVSLAAIWTGDGWLLYVDGRQVETSETGFDLQPTEGGLYIGGVPFRLPGHTEDRWFSGQLDELRISNIARYDGESYHPASRFTPDGNTLALFHFDETDADGDRLIDSSRHNHHGRIVGAARVAENGEH